MAELIDINDIAKIIDNAIAHFDNFIISCSQKDERLPISRKLRAWLNRVNRIIKSGDLTSISQFNSKNAAKIATSLIKLLTSIDTQRITKDSIEILMSEANEVLSTSSATYKNHAPNRRLSIGDTIRHMRESSLFSSGNDEQEYTAEAIRRASKAIEEFIRRKESEVDSNVHKATEKLQLAVETAEANEQLIKGLASNITGLTQMRVNELVADENIKISDDEFKLSSKWMIISVCFFILTFLVSIILYAYDRCIVASPQFEWFHWIKLSRAHNCEVLDVNFATVGSRSIVSIGLLIMGIYSAVISDRHRRVAIYHRKFYVETNSLGPYLADLTKEQRDQVRIDLVAKYFGQMNYMEKTAGTGSLEDSILKMIGSQGGKSS
ncbi:hypothetical protein [Chitinimonas sp. BJYL2]|uniref:hypothetical protein n=1 Tax=Chitinimonas sp. BJYL2 TaxID=2976696 RepID=UPI0022B36D07|nr:hypothetical protein [Chitinimonas sp. BJYL2]